ncbi:hypothetical protein UlMin_010663 [Ulmus minor]
MHRESDQIANSPSKRYRRSHRFFFPQKSTVVMWLSKLKRLRWATVVLAVDNAVVVLLGGFLVFLAYPSCDRQILIPFLAVSLISGVRLAAMVRTGIAQEATATTILESPADGSAVTVNRHERRMRYKAWLWWTRFALVITVLQFVGATYLVFVLAHYVHHYGKTSDCILGFVADGSQWKHVLLVIFVIMVCSATLLHCFMGSDVLKWRSFYATKDDAWKAHYREVFDHGIREALCCLGRVKYLSVLEEDEVFSVARLLGDLVAYRASGTGHLELLAGLALLQKQNQSQSSFEGCVEAPEEQIQEALALHKFAEAAYTGPLLDFGRNPFLFPCVWLYRQGVLTPWMRNRQPILDGDNWWRGHATAFLKYVKLPPEVLRQGSVNQVRCKAAYFVLVLHHLRSIVIAVRGTETPEDLLTDGLCRECTLSAKDLDGLIKSSHIQADLKQKMVSYFPHYGHSGIVEAARNLFKQVEGNGEDDGSDSNGLLSSLLGAGCECEGYDVRIVGHSLGGSIAALLGMRLYHKYPKLRVYAYGPLPCVGSIVAEACSKFVTSIVLNDEFSARLSVGSILRLRAAAIMALSQDSTADTAMIFRLARRFLDVSKYQRNRTEIIGPSSDVHCGTSRSENLNDHSYRSQDHFDLKGNKEHEQDRSLLNETDIKDPDIESSPDDFTNLFTTEVVCDNPVAEFMETVPSSENASAGDPPEMYLPGIVIHIVPQPRSFPISLWKNLGALAGGNNHKAYIASRESFKDIIVSPLMFLDHLPWRCDDAMRKVLEARGTEVLLRNSQVVDVH